jgi:hypothetical protein
MYMDDLIIATLTTETLAEHCQKVHRVLACLAKHDLYLRLSKCEFERSSTSFLGIIVSYNTTQMDPKKLQGVADWKQPKDATGIHRFLGFTGFYRHFVTGYSDLVRPLLNLTKKAEIWHWSDAQEMAFQELKRRMTGGPILRQPDFSKQFFVQTDTLANGVGTICHRLDKRLNCPHLGSSIVLPFRLRLAPIPTPLVLVQRVIVITTSCPGIGLGRRSRHRSVVIVAGRRQEALGLRHSSRQTDDIVLL